MSFISADGIGGQNENQVKILSLMALLSSDEKLQDICKQLYDSMASTGDSIEKRELLVLICDTIDQDNNIGSNALDFDTFVDKYLSGDAAARKPVDADQNKSVDENGSILSLKEITTFVTSFLKNRMDKLKNDVKQVDAAAEQQALLFSDLISQKSKQYPKYSQSVMDYNEEYEDIQIEDFPDIHIQNSVYAGEYIGDPQDIVKESSDATNSLQVSPSKKPKRKRTKAEKEELKKKLKYFKMVCGGQFDGKNQNEAPPVEKQNDAPSVEMQNEQEVAN